MSSVTSKDGTSIAYTRAGTGPAVILVGGALDDGAENAPLAAELATSFTVINYARRGRAESGDTLPYAVERELDDLEALLAVAGEPAHVFGASSGGGLVLEAAAAGLPVGRLAVYEVPYIVDEPMRRAAQSIMADLRVALADGRRGAAVELFMQLAGSSEDDIAGARKSPYWAGLEAVAPTLAYDAACMNSYDPPLARLATISRPTLVMVGGLSSEAQPGMGGVPTGFFSSAADAIVAAIPAAERVTLERQGHVADPVLLGSALARFFTA